MTNQPIWREVWQTDTTTLYEDTTGVYSPELEVIEDQGDDSDTELVYRYSVDRLKVVTDDDGQTHVVPFRYDATWPHPVHRYNEWFIRDLASVAESYDTTRADLVDALCSEDAGTRACAYEAIAGYHGLDNFDSYPRIVKKDSNEIDEES